jgi:cation diffusion facilitator CzcD-associated flavoprotein CzcO
MIDHPPVCIIGAGISGLAAAKQLSDRGIDFEWFEMGSSYGGNWRYDNDSDRSAAYASLRIDTSKERFAFSDLPMPKSWPAYLHHTQVLEYLEKYVETFALEGRANFRHQVIRVEPAGDEWNVTIRNLDDGVETTDRYRAVIVANGHHWSPNIPETEGPFQGQIMHAQQYRTPEPFIGKDVVVVGVGNTGVDIASELSWHAESVTLSARTGAHVLPRYVLGRPLDNWSTRGSSKMPLSVQRAAYASLIFMARGRQESYGFPVPDGPLLSQHPTVNEDILRLVKDGQVDVKRGISRTTESEVVFADGTVKPADTIIYATGYRISFPFLSDEVLAVDENRVELFKRVVSPAIDGLYFVGLIQPVGALPPLAEQQARWVAQLIDGAPLPTVAAMQAEIQRDQAALKEQYQDRPRHTIQVDYWPYIDEMRELCEANEEAMPVSSTPEVGSGG